MPGDVPLVPKETTRPIMDLKDSKMRCPIYRTLKHYNIPQEKCRKCTQGIEWMAHALTSTLLKCYATTKRFKRAERALRGGNIVELCDVEAMWEACSHIFTDVLGFHRRPKEARMSTLVTRRYEAYAYCKE